MLQFCLPKTSKYSVLVILINIGVFSNTQGYQVNDTGENNEILIGEYISAIERLEASQGVYHVGIAEHLMRLGEVYDVEQRYDQAHQIYQRALHVHRVNYGLHSKEQVPIVKKVIEANLKRENWNTLNSNYKYLDWVYRRVYEKNPEDAIPNLEYLANAKLNLSNKLPTREQLVNLNETQKLYQKIVKFSEGRQEQLETKLNALYGVSITNYQIALMLSDPDRLQELINDGFQDDFDAELANYDRMFGQSFRQGRDAIESVIAEHETNPALSIESQITAMTYLGDWYLVFNKTHTAKEVYDQTHQLIVASNSKTDSIHQLFARPVPLPVFHERVKLDDENTQPLTDDKNYIQASLDVTASGKARNIRLNKDGDNKSKRSYHSIKKILATTRFRPRFENGQPVKTKDFKVKYVFPIAGTQP